MVKNPTLNSIISCILVSTLTAVISSFFVKVLKIFYYIYNENWTFLFWIPLIIGPIIYFAETRVEQVRPLSHQPLWRVIVIFITSALSHLGGMSVGREGAAEIGKRLGQSVTSLHHGSSIGLAAAFSTLFVNPFIGFFLIYEYQFNYRINLYDSKQKLLLIELFISGIIGYLVGTFFDIPHWVPQESNPGPFLISPSLILGFGGLILAGILIFWIERPVEKLLSPIPRLIKFFIAAMISMIVTLSLSTARYNSLGIVLLDDALRGQANWLDWTAKSILSLVALLGTWPGGFFLPLIIMGATFGSAISQSLNLGQDQAYLLVSIGCFLWIIPRFKCPITCSILCFHMFGIEIGFISVGIYIITHLLNKYILSFRKI